MTLPSFGDTIEYRQKKNTYIQHTNVWRKKNIYYSIYAIHAKTYKLVQKNCIYKQMSPSIWCVVVCAAEQEMSCDYDEAITPVRIYTIA